MNFENLDIWKRSLALSVNIYKHFSKIKDLVLSTKLPDLVCLFLVIFQKVVKEILKKSLFAL